MTYLAKAVRMSDIAEQLQISTVTVSKALAGKDGVSEELRKKIQKLAVEMGYQFQKNKQEQTPCYTIGIITSYRYIEKDSLFTGQCMSVCCFIFHRAITSAFWKSFQNPLNKPVQCPV
ncbi:MAG: helix-turn-helix domain-containing protein [Ruminococcus sp.]